MKHEIVELFARPIIRLNLNLNVDGLAEIFYTQIKNKCKNTIVGARGLIHYCNDSNVFELYEDLIPYGKTIIESANFVYRDILNHKSKLKFTNAWFNECDIGGHQFMHNHCNSLISGTLYLNTDKNTCIEFQSPFGLSEIAPVIYDDPDNKENKFGYSYHSDLSRFQVKNGDCLFWHSYLKHGYPTNQTPKRLSLSFNFIPENFNHIYKI